MKRNTEDLRADSVQAFADARPYHQELRQIYRYFMPFREPTVEQSPESGGPSQGQARTDYLFDGTGISAAANFAGTLQADWMPPHQEFFKLEAGPFITDESQRQGLNRSLAQVSARVHAVLPRVHVVAHEMMTDLFAGTGAMYLMPGNSARVMNAAAVPISELALVEGPWGEVWEIHWKRKRKLRHLEALWPKGKFSDRLKREIKDHPNTDTEVTQVTYYDPDDDIWRLCVFSDKDEKGAEIWTEEFETNPWITPRMFKAPGEAFGRGLAHLALPFVKTANRGRELALKAAAFAILGVWIRQNDQVFNPATATFDPGAMWTVSSTGGSRGASVARLPVPQDFDITTIVMQEEREQIRKVLLDDELPAEQDAVRSATEVAGRLRRYARNRGGTGARLAHEMVVPIVQRTADILYQGNMLPAKITIDQILTKVTITAPAAAAMRAGKVEAVTNWLQLILMTLGPQALVMVAKIEEVLPELGRWLGVEETYIRDKLEPEKLQQMVAQLVAAQQQQEAAGRAKPPSPQQPYKNGAM